MTAVGLIVAAGSGARFGGAAPKGFAILAGAPLLVHAVRAFANSAAISSVVLVVAPERVEEAVAAVDRAGLAVGAVVAGGATRGESVRRGLAACPADATVVAVHDAARPLVSGDLVARTVGALVEPWAAVAPGLPVVDTMKLVDAPAGVASEGGPVLRTVDRAGVWVVQTPQVFAIATLRAAHDMRAHDSRAQHGGQGQSDRPGEEHVTDDLMLVERSGGRVRLIEGQRRNFKITFPEDLVMAEALLASERRP